MFALSASVVIPAYNAGAYIDQCLAGLAKQTLPLEQFEIIIVDDGSTDNTVALAEETAKTLGFPHFKLLSQANAGPGPARNHGIRHAKADIVVFLDSDCIPRPDWLENIIRPLNENPDMMGVEGQTVPGPGEFTPLKHYVENRTGGLWWTCNIAYRREVLYQVGGFDEAFRPACEDMDMGYRVSRHGEIRFEPRAEVEHILLDWPMRKHFKRAREFPSLIRMWKKHPGFLLPEKSDMHDLVLLQLKSFVFPWIRFGGWLFKNPWVFAKLSLLYVVWIADTLLRLPLYYREAAKPLVVSEPLVPGQLAP